MTQDLGLIGDLAIPPALITQSSRSVGTIISDVTAEETATMGALLRLLREPITPA